MPGNETPPGAPPPDPGSDATVDSGWSSLPPAPAPAPVAPEPNREPLRPQSKRRAEGTLLGVAPPRSPAEPAQRGSPTVVHAGLAPAEAPAKVPVGVASQEAALPLPVAPQGAPEPPSAAAPVAPEPPFAAAPVAPEPPFAAAPVAPEPPVAAPPLPQPPPTPPAEARRFVEQDAAPFLKPPVAPVAMAAHAEPQALTPGGALALRVRSFGIELPLWLLLVPLVLASLAAGLLVALAVGSRRAPPAPTPIAAPAAPIAPTAEASAATPTVDVGAIEAKAPESRTIAEVLSLAGAGAEKKRDAANRFNQDLLKAASPPKKATLAELRKLVGDPLTAPQTLAAVASLPGPLGPDLLYELWTGTPNKTDATELARALLSSQDVHSRVSDSLSVALHLRAIEACADLVPLLERTRQVGDKRSLPPLAKWKRKRVCSAAIQKDCCSADQGKDIDATLDALKTRKAPFD